MSERERERVSVHVYDCVDGCKSECMCKSEHMQICMTVSVCSESGCEYEYVLDGSDRERVGA